MGRSTDHLPEQLLLLREWRQIIVLQALVTVVTLPMLPVHPAPTVAATAFNLLAILNTCRIRRARATHNRAQPSPSTGKDLASVSACVLVSALSGLTLVLWPR